MSIYLTITKLFLGLTGKLIKNWLFFVFKVLPFGPTTAPFLFTKVARPLIKYWRLHAIRKACFLDDGIGIEFGISKSKLTSKFAFSILIRARFVS